MCRMFALGVIGARPYADRVSDARGDVLWTNAQACALWRAAAQETSDAQASAILSLMARCTYVAQAATGIALIIGGSTDVTVAWPAPGFPTDVYAVDILPLALVGKATAAVIAQTAADVTVRVTAGLALALGTQFLVVGRS